MSSNQARRGHMSETNFVEKPWGGYEILSHGGSFLVKRLVVKPGGVLSLQRHKYRSEVWVIACGRAKVTVGNTIAIAENGDTIRIPIDAVHRMENEGGVDLEVIETQFGTILSEDDIVRLEDAYGRT